MHAEADRGKALPGGDGGEGETCGESSKGGGAAAAAAVSWRGCMRRPSSVVVASGLVAPSLSSFVLVSLGFPFGSEAP